uniref:Tip4d n=1 Tax=Arundo donax TaxID=35708 RepID=A0A0A9CRJ7_ARUDO
MAKFALDHHREAAEAGCVRAVLTELILTFLFVFSGVGSAMATGRLAGGADSIVGLTAVALAHTLVVAVMVSAGLHVSGGHINPAVTLGLAVTGRITLFRSALYVVAQLLGSTLACLLLTFLTGGVSTPVHALAPGGASPWRSCSLSRCSSRCTPQWWTRGAMWGPWALCSWAWSSAPTCSPAGPSPARSFGPALAAGVWADHWVYWVGPLIGGPLAGLVYEGLFMGPVSHEPLPTDDTEF